MDHLHEELKQPMIVSDDDEVDVNNSNEKTTTKYKRHCVTSSAIECDTSDPSDTDYETCDSGLSSESNSVTADVGPRTDNHDDTLVQHGIDVRNIIYVVIVSF